MVSEETKPKKQRNEECIINRLPGDLIEQIFFRLPVSTLVCCTGVSKQWHTIIRDPQFVASHLQQAPHCVLLFFPQESVSGKPYPSDAIVIDGAWSQSKWAVPVIGPDDFLCGSCNGLICLYTKRSTIKIANLATGEHLHLEKPVKNSTGDHCLFYSFGYHPSTKEYKIIHFLGDHCEGRSRLHIDRKFSVIQVYTLGDEKWRDVRTPEALSLNCVKNSGAINFDGIIYWLTEDAVASWQHALMTFDLGEESFARIELPAAVPEDCAGGAPRRYWIREIDGKVSIATAQVYPSERRRLFGKLQIWTLDNKEEQRWSQTYNIQYPPDYIPGPNLSHGDKIILPRLDGNLYYFEFLGENLNTKLGKMAKLLDFSPRKPGNMQSYIFVKSLVRLDAYKKAGIVRRPKQREGWESKKWEAWEHEHSKNETSWSNIHEEEHKGTASAQRYGVIINDLLCCILDDEIRQQISMQINQIFPNFPNQQPRPLRRLNFVEQERDMENFDSCMRNWFSVMKATSEATCSILSMIRSATRNQMSPSFFKMRLCRRRNEACFINCLPRDLIERVFLRLPVSTLLMCVGVCKPWQKLIRDPHFVTLHLRHASRFALIFFGKEFVAGERYPSDAIMIDEAWSQSTHAVPAVGPDDIIFGSCNGLLGLYTNTSSIKIANLATGECLRLEKPVKNLMADHFSFYSFGFHTSAKEYKITHFLGDYLEGCPLLDDRFNVIQVYILGDETWKDIRTPEDLSLNCVRNSGTINIDGTIYWLTEDMSAIWQHAVMSFDLGEESFERIQLPASVPEDCASGGPRQYWIREMDRKICIATAQTCRYKPRQLSGKLQIWTLDDKAEQRWSHKYNIHATDYILGPNLDHGEKLLAQGHDGYLCSYEFIAENVTGKVVKMEKLLDFSPRKPQNMQSYSCVKSLVRLDVYKKAGIVCRPNQREGWELKKWKVWQHKLSKIEKLWSCIHQKEHESIEFSQQIDIWLNDLLPRVSVDLIRQQIAMKIGQIFPVFPDKQPRSLRRLNFVEQKRDIEDLDARINKCADFYKARTQAVESIISMIDSATQDQVGASS